MRKLLKIYGIKIFIYLAFICYQIKMFYHYGWFIVMFGERFDVRQIFTVSDLSVSQ